MSTIMYQYENINDDYYTDGFFNYILTSSYLANMDKLPEIVKYCKTYIPLWNPVLRNRDNKLIFNAGSMFELIFYKNIICLIPLYISNYSLIEYNLLHIKDYLDKYTFNKHNKNLKILSNIVYKLFIYSPVNNHQHFKYIIQQTNKTILDTTLYTFFYESHPIILNINY